VEGGTALSNWWDGGSLIDSVKKGGWSQWSGLRGNVLRKRTQRQVWGKRIENYKWGGVLMGIQTNPFPKTTFPPPPVFKKTKKSIAITALTKDWRRKGFIQWQQKNRSP